MHTRGTIFVKRLLERSTLDQHQGSLRTLAAITSTHVLLEEELEKPHSRIWIAQGEDASVHAYLLAWQVADELQIIDLATLPDSRRRGCGHALLEALISFGKEQHSACALLEVRADNSPAIALYQKMGFETHRLRPRYYDDGQAALEMGMPL